MDTKEFLKRCIEEVLKEYNNSQEAKINEDDVHIVWVNKTLQNNKAILSVRVKGNMKLCECTGNGNTKEIYLDGYGKEFNRCIKL